MPDDFDQTTDNDATLRGGRAAMALLLVLVFLPIPLSMAIARATGADGVVLASIVASVGLGTVALRMRGSGWRDLGMRRGAGFKSVLAVSLLGAVFLLIATIVASSLLSRFFGIAPDISKFDNLRGNVGALLGIMVVVWTTAAFGEEMLFRGLLMNWLQRLLGPDNRATWTVALVSTSLLFGAAHAYQGAAGVILTGLVGFGVGALYLATNRNLWAAILTHGIYDTIGFVLVYTSWDRVLSA